MSVPGHGSRMNWCRALLAAAAVMLLLGPSVAALQHQAHPIVQSALVHSEAAHPDASPHLDRKDPSKDGCPICLHDARAFGEQLTDSSLRVVHTALASPGAPVHVIGRDAHPDRARAPPA